VNISEWDGTVDPNIDISGTLAQVTREMLETSVSRTPFQLAHFVIHYHGGIDDGAGPIMRQQALTEINNIMTSIMTTRIELERKHRQAARLRDKKPEDYDLDLALLEIQTRKEWITLHRKLREYIVLVEILDQLPTYTWQEFQAEEPRRWANRLLRQCDEYHEALVRGLDRGDVQAIHQGQTCDVLPEIGQLPDHKVLFADSNIDMKQLEQT